jgi:hypothetical protein
MTNPQEHVVFDDLNDFVDRRLGELSEQAVREHLERCPRCSAEHLRLLDVLSAARNAPRSVLPSDDLWPSLKEQLAARKTLVLPTDSGSEQSSVAGHNRPTRRWTSAPYLAAAAILLVVLSSGITALVLRGGADTDRLAVDNAQAAPAGESGAPVVLPAGFQQTELEYKRTIRDLQSAVDAQRGRLSPETVQTVERSLAVVDSAIAEARGALLADPNNRVLVDLLSASYQRKLDLLRRTSELGSRI